MSELTTPRHALLPPEVVVGRLNRLLTGWANYFTLGQVSPAYEAIDRHATRRLRQWLCRKHKVRTGKHVRFPVERLWSDYGLTHLCAAYGELSVGEGMISSESRMREICMSGSMSVAPCKRMRSSRLRWRPWQSLAGSHVPSLAWWSVTDTAKRRQGGSRPEHQ